MIPWAGGSTILSSLERCRLNSRYLDEVVQTGETHEGFRDKVEEFELLHELSPDNGSVLYENQSQQDSNSNSSNKSKHTDSNKPFFQRHLTFGAMADSFYGTC
jgi:hypothetical protein